ncbi:bifunctional DNA primase/polymerase [Neoroseomonas oryzicola]|uniref:DNA primase/polymerase bifunctional N-terminal domain-containing protein n=1 Tax=Neoroseomonas oryzicola TaxID=535904 RepID=A0A9X9WDG5_9PROT|nr:bifunctional DNA primase/polymerase [Neoroseomonas oryzicola]MBR0658375.1 hypothetical protein [Neoroseomonas oryzicola]NKE18540.1 hypothetical protein [Neoroseomonas oryzicola]
MSRFGETLVRNGYAVIPIVAGTKRPPGWMSHKNGDSWSAVKPDLARVRRWLNDKRLAGAGVGINLGRNLFAIDIDILDPELVGEALDWCMWNLPGNPPQRIGLAPKVLLLFRTEAPIKKIASAEFVDAQGRKAQIEGLGEGEQFVAYAIHPDTKKPYEWPGADPLEVKAADLPPITVAQVQALKTWFENRCKALGWAVKRRGSSGLTVEGDEDDWTRWIDTRRDLPLPSRRRIEAALAYIPPDARDIWLRVGGALKAWAATSGEEIEDLFIRWSRGDMRHDGARVPAAYKGESDCRHLLSTLRRDEVKQ